MINRERVEICTETESLNIISSYYKIEVLVLLNSLVFKENSLFSVYLHNVVTRLVVKTVKEDDLAGRKCPKLNEVTLIYLIEK